MKIKIIAGTMVALSFSLMSCSIYEHAAAPVAGG